LHDVLLTVPDNGRFRQMALRQAGQEAGLVPAARGQFSSARRVNEADWASEQIDGVENPFFLRRLAEEVDQDWPAVLAPETMRELLVRRGNRQ
jgi:hypothetical protein